MAKGLLADAMMKGAGGAVKQAASAVDLRKEYSGYATDAAAGGDTPLAFPDWLRSRGFEIREGAVLPVRTQ